jgi:asparagine synthase (glutamine-hydrolysing)
MCGICGILSLDGQPIALQTLTKMSTTLAYRGPDGEGYWNEGPIGLGHRRLAIVDLTPSGSQPMSNENGDIIVSYNGEMYNHNTLRVKLEAAGHHYRSRSDTETIIHAYEEWGVDCLSYFNGMFAFAIWDVRAQQLILARDRFGIKPVYYYFDGKKLVFASEIKAILAYPDVPKTICYPALNEYFTFQNILTDLTLFDGIKILPAGHYLKVNMSDTKTPVLRQYWDFDFSRKIKMSLTEATEELYRLFSQSVARQLMSDVPIGSFLSGGMDSGSITAVARQHLGRLTTFTGGFDLSSASGLELGFDERASSEILANLLKTEHYEMVLHAGDMEHIMPELIWHLEDLRAGQCYPNYYVSRLASKFVKVTLSGAGGDELFGGYPWRYYRGAQSKGPDDYYRSYYDFWQRLVPDEDKSQLFTSQAYHQMLTHPTFDVFKSVFARKQMPLETPSDFINASFYFELKTFLHGLLVVEDKVSMAHSLEVRVPFLDNDLVDFACQIPPEFKLRHLGEETQTMDENDPGKRVRYDQYNQDGKVILRDAMRKIIPQAITDRAKQGFSAPDASWFRGESIDYVHNLLRNPKARIHEFLQPEYVDRKLDEHETGSKNNRLFIWSALSFEWWLRGYFS